MPSAAIIGHTTSLKYSDASNTTAATSFTAVSEIKSITVPSPEVTDVDVTNLESASYTKEFIAGLIDPGEVTMTLSYGKTQTAAIYARLRSTKWWTITAPDASTWLFEGYVKGFGQEQIESESEITNTCTIKVTSKPVFTAGA